MKLKLELVAILLAIWGSPGSAYPGSSTADTIQWNVQTNAQFNYNGQGYNMMGLITANGKIYGMGTKSASTPSSPGFYPSGMGDSVCVKGSADSAGNYALNGIIGDKSVSATGKYIISRQNIGQSSSEKSGSATIGNVTIGSTAPAPAICGYINKMYDNSSGTVTDQLEISGSGRSTDSANVQTSYDVRVSMSSSGTGMTSQVSISKSNPQQPTMYPGQGCINSIVAGAPNTWTAEGQAGQKPLSASGIYEGAFWMVNQLTTSTKPSVFAGSYSSSGCNNPQPGSSIPCIVTVHATQGVSGVGGAMINGMAYPSNKTWQIRMQQSMGPSIQMVFDGTFADDGTFKGSGDSAGFAWSVIGKWGLGCVYTTQHNISCSTKPITGLPTGSYHGCGTASLGPGSFSGSGTYKGTPWTVSGTMASTSPGGMPTSYYTINGTVTYKGTQTTFQTIGSPSSGLSISINFSGTYHMVTVVQLGTKWVAIGRAGGP